MALQVGRELQSSTDGQRYRLEEVLGEGGQAVVWRAARLSDGRWVAVKVMKYLERAGQKTREIVLVGQIEEAVLGRRLQGSRHFVEVYDIFMEAGSSDTASGLLVTVMELVEGNDLEEVFASYLVQQKEQRGEAFLPWDLAFSLAVQVAEGLEEAQSLGKEKQLSNFVHRDLKPANLMLTYDGIVKILDLGVSNFEQRDVILQTMSGQLRGTPVYSSPEYLMQSHPVTVRSDLFSLGVILHYLLTQQMLLGTFDYATHIQRLAFFQPAQLRLHEKNPHIPLSAIQAIYTLLAPNPSERPPTAGAACSLLLDALSKGGKALWTATQLRDWLRMLFHIHGSVPLFSSYGVPRTVSSASRTQQEISAPFAQQNTVETAPAFTQQTTVETVSSFTQQNTVETPMLGAMTNLQESTNGASFSEGLRANPSPTEVEAPAFVVSVAAPTKEERLLGPKGWASVGWLVGVIVSVCFVLLVWWAAERWIFAKKTAFPSALLGQQERVVPMQRDEPFQQHTPTRRDEPPQRHILPHPISSRHGSIVQSPKQQTRDPSEDTKANPPSHREMASRSFPPQRKAAARRRLRKARSLPKRLVASNPPSRSSSVEPFPRREQIPPLLRQRGEVPPILRPSLPQARDTQPSMGRARAPNLSKGPPRLLLEVSGHTCRLSNDDKDFGERSHYDLELSEGTHHFFCMNKSKRIAWAFQFSLKQRQVKRIHRDFRMGHLLLRSEPWCAIWLPRFGMIGKSGEMIALPKGSYLLYLRRLGRDDQVKRLSVQIVAGRTQTSTVAW